MIDHRTITTQICACLEQLARSGVPSSSLGALADGCVGVTRQQQVAAGRHDSVVVNTVDRLSLFRHCSSDDIAVLIEKYHNAPELRDVVRLVPGRSHGMVRVGYLHATFQSNASCARALGLRNARAFERALTRARSRVRQALEERAAA